ncbi:MULTISPECIES: hypothetical protein [unclassified Gordonia (in: high G+C Gram-positive bacteria)]
MVDIKWRYWQILDRDDESVHWLAISRPDARPRIDRIKLWTLLPDSAVLVANWFVSEDHQRAADDRTWVHDSITGWDFCEAAADVQQPSPADLSRIGRPESVLTVDQIDRIPLAKVIGKREAERVWDARRA